jgi:hypothetical protein
MRNVAPSRSPFFLGRDDEEKLPLGREDDRRVSTVFLGDIDDRFVGGRVNGDHHRSAANLAVLDILLVRDGGVDQQFDRLTAVGTQNGDRLARDHGSSFRCARSGDLITT